MSRTAIQGMVLMLVVFILGAFSGVAMDRVWLNRHSTDRDGRRDRRRHDPDRLFERLRGQLDLTDDQARVVRAAMKEAHEEMQRVRADSMPRIRAALDRSRAKITAVLSAKQAQRFEEVSPKFGHKGWREHDAPPQDSTGTATVAPARR